MFRELYFWMYYYISKIKTNDNPAENAQYILLILQTLNAGLVFIILNYFLKVEIDKKTIILIALTFGVILLIVNHFTLYKKKEEIFKKYESYPPARKRKGKIVFWAYFLLSNFLFFFFASILVAPKY